MFRGSGYSSRFLRLALVAAPVALLVSGAAPSRAQSTRDTASRIYRLQLRQAGDTDYVRSLRRARVKLQERLDSLQREFEGLSLESPDRLPRLRELSALLSSVGALSELEQTTRGSFETSRARLLRDRARSLVQGEVFAAPLARIDATLPQGWIGINVEAPHQRIVRGDSSFIRYFSYPEILSVEPNSPAERAGISRGDRLVAYNGADLRDREINLTKLLQPSRRITVTVRRDGDEREFPIVVAKAPPRLVERRLLTMPDEPTAMARGVVVMPRGGARVQTAPRARVTVFGTMDPSSAPVAGANLSEIHDEAFGHIFGVSDGVLVTEVFSDPARSSGLRGGDVIRRADGERVTRIAQLRRIVADHNGDREVELEIVRQKRTRTITLRW